MPGRAASTEVILLDSVRGAASVVVASAGSRLAQKWRALFLRRLARPGGSRPAHPGARAPASRVSGYGLRLENSTEVTG